LAALGAASVGALAAGLLRVSPVLGYIAAGLVIGPHTPGFVADIPTVEDLADIGVALLMFAIGVQLSFSQMRRVAKVAIIGGNLQVLTLIGVGFGFGTLLGWGWLEALFFGAVLSNSSSTVLSKVLADRGEEASLPGQIALGWSTVQDIGTVILVVVLTTLAEGGNNHFGIEVLEAVGLAALFLAIVAPVGLFVLPRFFEQVARLGSSEVFVLAATGVALGIAFLATAFGVSIALGAFVGGLLVGRSDLSHEILGQIRPLRDIFVGLFFVSVGMLLDPALVVDSIWLVVATTLILVVFKGGLSAGIVLAFGYRGRSAMAAGALLAQSAEFSFLMARVGVDVEALSGDVFGVLLASAAISIILAPLVHSAAEPLGRKLEARLPLAADAELPETAPARDHVILCGYGRVGRVIGDMLAERNLDVIVIEQDGGIVRQLRDRGVPALHGSASNETLLERAGIDSARALIVATPDPLATRQILETARRRNASIDIVVRTHSHAERRFLESRGANEAVVGELELALEMARHVLERFGVSADQAQHELARLRRADTELA
jgi:CPA2 family monovalent cation:H+ antiporter-2